MFREELYDQIERYLAGSMEPPERSGFEARLAAEPELAEELALHRKLQAELGDASKRDLRVKLKKISAEFTEDERSEAVVKPLRSNWTRILSIAATILLAGILLYFWTKSPDKSNELVVDPDPPKQEEKMQPETPPIDPPEERIAEDQPPSTPEEESPIPPEQPPIAPPDESLAALEPNLEFEKLVGQLPPAAYSITLESPLPGATLTASEGRIDLAFNGLLETSLEEKDLKLRLLLFDNQAGTATAAAALQAYEVRLEAAETDIEEEGLAFAMKDPYYFDMQQSLALSPGLYYYSLVNPASPSGSADQTLLVGKFTVKE